LREFLADRAEGDLVAWAHQAEAMRRFQVSCAEAEEAILEAGLLPTRYQRNRQMISTAQQLRLFRSRVAVVGCGGLGGYLLEELARMGIGCLVAIDPDAFEEHNLNRQLLSSPATLGRSKAVAAVERISEINPSLYSRWSGGRGIEADLGNPAFTPAVVASLQVAEIVKVLLGPRPTRG
jgi:hypothetical protein